MCRRIVLPFECIGDRAGAVLANGEDEPKDTGEHRRLRPLQRTIAGEGECDRLEDACRPTDVSFVTTSGAFGAVGCVLVETNSSLAQSPT